MSTDYLSLLAKQSAKSAINFFPISNRLRALLLFWVSTVSFVIGLGYGISHRVGNSLSQNNLDTPEYIEEEGTSETPSLPKPSATKIPPKVNIKIKAVGDVVPGTNYPENKLHPQKKVLFQSVKPILKGADLLFGNFESTLTNYPDSPKGFGNGLLVAFRTPPSYTQLLKDAGFDVMSVANNHSFDFSDQGFADTIRNLEKASIQALGKKGQILIAHRKGLSIAWIGFSFLDDHNSIHNLNKAKALVQKARQNADIVVISVHGGAEGTKAMHIRNQTEFFAGENRGNLVEFAHTMINNGADLILGHSPHVPRALELYKGKLIAYSLGNFMGYRTLATDAELADSLVLEVELNHRGDFVSGKIIPVLLNQNGIPYPDRQNRSVALIRQLTQSDFPKTRLTINNRGEILPRY